MIDVTDLDLCWRGYPVTVVSENVARQMRVCDFSRGMFSWLREILDNARDTAEPNEPSGWLFASRLHDGCAEVWIERHGGVRSQDQHNGGEWSVYLPDER